MKVTTDIEEKGSIQKSSLLVKVNPVVRNTRYHKLMEVVVLEKLKWTDQCERVLLLVNLLMAL